VIAEAYLSSEEGKKHVIKKINDALEDVDLFNDDRVTDVVVEFLKKRLECQLPLPEGGGLSVMTGETVD
jgi:hypothetical protein